MAKKRVLGMRFTVVIYLLYDSAQHKVFGVSCHAFAGYTHFSHLRVVFGCVNICQWSEKRDFPRNYFSISIFSYAHDECSELFAFRYGGAWFMFIVLVLLVDVWRWHNGIRKLDVGGKKHVTKFSNNMWREWKTRCRFTQAHRRRHSQWCKMSAANSWYTNCELEKSYKFDPFVNDSLPILFLVFDIIAPAFVALFPASIAIGGLPTLFSLLKCTWDLLFVGRQRANPLVLLLSKIENRKKQRKNWKIISLFRVWKNNECSRSFEEHLRMFHSAPWLAWMQSAQSRT